MKKIKWLHKLGYKFLENKKVYNKIERIKNTLHKALKNSEKVYYTKYIDEKINALSEFDISDNDRIMIRVVAMNTLKNINLYSDISSLPTKITLNITIKVMQNILKGIGKVISVQPMDAAIAKVFRMVYRDENGNEVPNDELNSENLKNKKISLNIISQAIESYYNNLSSTYLLEYSEYVDCTNIEIEKTIALEITNEIISKILIDIIDNCDHDTYDHTYDAVASNGFSYLNAVISKNCNEIARTTKLGSGNFIIVSPIILSLMQNNKYFCFVPSIYPESYQDVGLSFEGTINGSIKVYTRIFSEHELDDNSERIIVGYKGKSTFYSGYIFSPHVPVGSKSALINPTTFQPEYSLYERSNSQLFDKNYYRIIDIKKLF